METKKAAWRKPELIVLARRKPEEAVLSGCKQFSQTGVGGNQYWCGKGCVACSNHLES